MKISVQDNPVKGKKMYIYLAMFLLSMSLFIYQVLLTRLFSAVLNSGFVFLVVSLAILGSGLGGVYSYRRLKKNNKLTEKDLLVKFSIWLPVSMLATVGVIYYLPYVPVFLFYILAGTIPFFIGGIEVSVIFKDNIEGSKLYFMDLIGSALGSLAVIQLMNKIGFLSSTIAVCMISLGAAVLISIRYERSRRALISAASIFVLGIVLVQGGWIKEAEKYFNSFYTNPEKIVSYLKETGESPLGISFSKWDAISRTDVIDSENDNQKIISTDGGGSAPIIKFNGDFKSVEYLKGNIKYIPFTFGKNESTLVIGSGGGMEVLVALLGGSEKIDAVEINPSTIDAVNEFKEFSGDIYNRPGVKLYVEDGRNFINNSSEKYDNIYLSMVMTNAVENNTYALSENYIFTYEAFNKYFDHLNGNGKLNFMTHDVEDTLRVVNTGIKVLMDRGVKQEDITKYFIIINSMSSSHMKSNGIQIDMPLIMFKNQPFTNEELAAIKSAVVARDRVIIQSPEFGIDIYEALKNKEMSYKELLDLVPFNSAPITDNSPFFYNYSKFIPVQLLIVIIGITMVIVLLWIIMRKAVTRARNRNKSIYFAGLGMAYMLVEIPVIQKMTMYFGSPSLAFSFMLFSLLVSSGIGSRISGSKAVRKITDKSPIYLLAAAIGVILVSFMIGAIMDKVNELSVYIKFIAGFATILPMGLLMGIPFPTGITRLKDVSEETIPFMWGVNGIFSVAGSALAVLISMKLGFDIALYTGALIYLALFLLNPFKKSKAVN